MGVLETLARGRARANEAMTDRCVVRRPTGKTVTDPETLAVSREFEVVYDPAAEPHRGRCKFQTYQAYENSRESAGATVTTQRSTLHFPVGAFHALPGDLVTCIEAVDAFMVGSSARIAAEAPSKSHATAYRVFVDESVGEEVPPWLG